MPCFLDVCHVFYAYAIFLIYTPDFTKPYRFFLQNLAEENAFSCLKTVVQTSKGSCDAQKNSAARAEVISTSNNVSMFWGCFVIFFT